MHPNPIQFSRRSLATAIATASFLAPFAVQAQDNSEATALDTIVVSDEQKAEGDTPAPAFAGGQVAAGARAGLLGEQDAADLPFNVVSYTEKLVENQQADTLADVLVNDASVQSGFGYGNYAEKFYIRGFELNGEDIAYGGLYGVLPRQVIDMSLAGRIEIFKGANAFTNGIAPGSSGIGGIVNIEPKRAGDEPLTRVTTGFESDGYGEVGLDVARRFGDQNQWGTRVSAKAGDGDTAIDDESRSVSAAAAGLDYRGDRFRASLDLGYQKQEIEGGRSIVYIDDSLTEIPDAPDADTNYAPDWAGSTLETTFAMLRGEYDLNSAWTAYAAVGGNNTHESGDYASPTVTDTDGSATVSRLTVPYDAKSIGSQAGLRGELATGPVSHQINLGYSGVYRRTSSAYTMSLTPADTNIYNPADVAYPATEWSDGDMNDPNVRSRTRTNGVALADTLGFIDDRVLLTLGTRYQEVEVTNYDYQGAFSDRAADYTMTPAYGLVVKPFEGVSLYANHMESLLPGEQAPSGTYVNGSYVAISNAGHVLGVVEAKQTEVGAKFDYGTIGGSVSAFQIEKPVAAVSSDDSTYEYYGEQRNRGVEVNVYGQPLDNVRLLASAVWLDPEITNSVDENLEGKDAIGVPEYRYVLGGEWDMPFLRHLTALGKVVHNGPQYADSENELEVDAWTRVDLGLRYEMPVNSTNIVWRFNVENVANENYWASASSSGYLTQGDPRTYKVSAEFNF
ncbi:TonB-dependent receptor [Marinobacter bohaiensis]|uniref:TonB-dependent receptor n=1 Tax=Marinobacter bohaiensis TaxID=2201898 RepID=UPI000DAC85EF|nr:TonB-dependent siderophore receptor [Marinobacter bohaiensis]